MNTFDEFEKSVALVIRDRKQKRCEKDSKLGKGIGLRHSEAFVVPCVYRMHTLKRLRAKQQLHHMAKQCP